VGEMLSIRT